MKRVQVLLSDRDRCLIRSSSGVPRDLSVLPTRCPLLEGKSSAPLPGFTLQPAEHSLRGREEGRRGGEESTREGEERLRGEGRSSGEETSHRMGEREAVKSEKRRKESKKRRRDGKGDEEEEEEV